MDDDGALVSFDLTPDERRLLFEGLLHFDGPADPTEEFARALGWASLDDLTGAFSGELGHRIENGSALTVAEWRKAVTALQVNFINDEFGTGTWEWEVITGRTSAESLKLVSSITEKVLYGQPSPRDAAIEYSEVESVAAPRRRPRAKKFRYSGGR